MEDIASWHAKGDIRFVETNAMKDVQEVLEDNHWVTILGKPGEGKTAMAAHLMLKHKQKGYEPVFLSAASDWTSLISGGKAKQFVIIDDMFGTVCLDEKKVNEWLSRLDNMCKIVEVRNGYILVVCTSRQYIFDDIKSKLERFNSFRPHQIVNLSSNTYMLTPAEKLNIFNAYADEKDQKAANEDEMKALDPPHGFPHCVVLFHTNVFLRHEGMSFFRNPSKYVRREIYNFKENDSVKLLVLLIVLLSNNRLTKEALNQWLYNNTVSQRRVIQALGISSDKRVVGIRKNLRLLEGTYIKRGPDGYYCFTHESLIENVVYVFASANPSLAMEVLDLKYIIAFCRLLKGEDSRTSGGTEYGIFKPLVERFIKEVKIGNVFNVSMCNAWRDKIFINEWINYVSMEPEKELQEMLSSPPNVRDNVLISLTQFSMDDAVVAILGNTTIRNKMKNCGRWMNVLKSGLEISAMEKDSIVLEAYAKAAHFKGSPCQLKGSKALMDVLQRDSAKNAMILIRETVIEPLHKDDNTRGYLHHLVKAKVTNEMFKQMVDSLLDLGIDINSEDFIGVSPLNICLNMFPSYETKEESDMAFDRFLYLLSKGAICPEVQKDFCDLLLGKVGITNFYKHIVESLECLFVPILRKVDVFDTLSVDITDKVRDMYSIFIKALTGFLEKKITIRTEAESQSSATAYQTNCIKHLKRALTDVCTKHLQLKKDSIWLHPFSCNCRTNWQSVLADVLNKHLQIATEGVCIKHLRSAFKDVSFIYLHRAFQNVCTKYLQLLPEGRYTTDFQFAFKNDCYEDFRLAQIAVFTKNMQSARRYNCTKQKKRAIFRPKLVYGDECNKHMRLVSEDDSTKDLLISFENICQERLRCVLKKVWKSNMDNKFLQHEVEYVCTNHLQLALEAVCTGCNNLSMMESLSTQRNLNIIKTSHSREERVRYTKNVFGRVSLVNNILHVDFYGTDNRHLYSLDNSLDDTFRNYCELISSACKHFQTDLKTIADL